jgi:hypothetical protein
LYPVGSAVHVQHSIVSRMQNVDALFFMLGWDGYGFHKKRAGALYAKLVFLHPVGSVSHVVHSVHPGRETSMHYSCLGGTGLDSRKSAPGPVTPNLCFCIRWDMQVT